MKNEDIRTATKKAGLRLWQVAEGLGIRDYDFSRRLRKELPPEEKKRVYQTIKELSGEVG